MGTIHFVLQGKGGVGKSLVATVLAQYLSNKSEPLLCIDTDPVNKTFAGFSALNVNSLHLMKDDEIDPTMFDKLIRLIVDHGGYNIVLDNGASSFIPLCSYLIQNDMASILAAQGFQIVIHTVVTGGQASLHTIKGLDALARQFPADAGLFVWKNGYFGEVAFEGKSFEQLGVYEENKHRIQGVVNIPKQSSLFELDIKRMLEKQMTFDEVACCADPALFDFISKNRIDRFHKVLFAQLDAAFSVVL